ncbi:MAG: GNAT family N-acetyltransferase, partial [Candidatus Nitrosopelagicus sp.]|nr:GNAT family N-acetyltransferase [Candidatus Nitrosopelagicus sp.]
MSYINLLKINFSDYDFSNIVDIRKSVFTDELGIPESELFDKYDANCDHFMLFDGKQVVGAVRLVSKEQNIKLERMAILSQYRSKNYGKHTILQLKEYYRTQGYSKIILDSIYSVRGFYKKCGFLEEGEIFQRVGID